MLRSLAAAMLLIAGPTAAVAADLPPTPSPASPTSPTDPWERQNRKFFGMNEGLDARVIRPAALGYEHRTPGPVRRGLRNFLTNLSEPVVFANDVLQLRFGRAGTTAVRFVTNSTIGVAGLFDVAGQSGVEHHSNGFGTTLGRYHVPPGPYVYLPVLGPSTVRDLAGAGLDGLVDPFTWSRFANRVTLGGAKTVVDGLDTRARADGDLQALMGMATDRYATLRSVYLQNRQTEIEGDLGGKLRDLPDFDDPQAPASTDKAPVPEDPPPPPADTPQPAPQASSTDSPRSAAPTIPALLAGAEQFNNSVLRRTEVQEERSGDAAH